MRVGVLVGTFDPIHIGHLVIAEEVRAKLALEKIVFVPAGQPPHKPAAEVTPIEHRLAMVRLAIAANPRFALSRVDIDRPGLSYTVDTIKLLRQEWGEGTEIFFLMGSDSLADLLSWHRPAELVELCWLAVVGRPGYHVELEKLEEALPGLSSRVILVPTPGLAISSTDLQGRVRQGLSIKYLVPEAVEVYIYDHGLYRGQEI